MEHGDAVGIAHGRDAVRNENRCASAHDLAQMIENLVFGLGVDTGQRVVEDQDARIANERAGDGDALFLPARERDTALPDHRLVLVRKALDVGGNIGGLGGGADLLIGRIFHAEGDVFANRVAEQERFLRNEADVAAQKF